MRIDEISTSLRRTERLIKYFKCYEVSVHQSKAMLARSSYHVHVERLYNERTIKDITMPSIVIINTKRTFYVGVKIP